MKKVEGALTADSFYKAVLLLCFGLISLNAFAGIPTVKIQIAPPAPIEKNSKHHAEFYTGADWPEGYVALTFDDGPHFKFTPIVLDILKKYDVKATFFMVGERVDFQPTAAIAKIQTDLAREIKRQGHTIGTHTYNHPNLTHMTADQAMDQIYHGIAAVTAAVGEISPFFRFPFLASNAEIRDKVANAGLTAFGWNGITLGGKYGNLAPFEGHLKKGVLITHDLQASSIEYLEQFLMQMDKYGYSAVIPVAQK